VDRRVVGRRVAPARVDDVANVSLVRVRPGGHLDLHDSLDPLHDWTPLRAWAFSEVPWRVDPRNFAVPLRPDDADVARAGAELCLPDVARGRNLRVECCAIEAAGGRHHYHGGDCQYHFWHLRDPRWLPLSAPDRPDSIRLRCDHAHGTLNLQCHRGGVPLRWFWADRIDHQRDAAYLCGSLVGLEFPRLLLHVRGRAHLHTRLHYPSGGVAACDGHLHRGGGREGNVVEPVLQYRNCRPHADDHRGGGPGRFPSHRGRNSRGGWKLRLLHLLVDDYGAVQQSDHRWSTHRGPHGHGALVGRHLRERMCDEPDQGCSRTARV